MTDDLERQIGARLRRAELPEASDALRARPAAVAATLPRSRGRAAELGRQGQFLVPLAAILVIGGLAIVGAGGRRDPQGTKWGPLAVSSDEYGAQSRNEGFLILTDSCAFLERDGERETLVWPEARTSWDAGSRTVTFRRQDDSTIKVRHGDYIEIGGGGSSISEDDLTAEAWLDRIGWVARPAPACVLDTRFVLNHVATIEPPPGARDPHAELTVTSGVYEWPCSPGGCEFHVKLEGPGGPWEGRVNVPEIGLAAITPRLPEILATGTYAIRTEIHVIGDVIYPNETGPRDYGISATCTSDFVVAPDTTVVAITLAFWASRCSAGTVTAADASSLASLNVLPHVEGFCGADVGGCDYRLALTGPGGSWLSTIRTVKPPSQLQIGPDLTSFLPPGAYRLEATSLRMSLEPEPGVGHQHELGVAATCFADFEVAPASTNVDARVVFEGESCTATAEVRVVGTSPPGPVGPVPTVAASP